MTSVLALFALFIVSGGGSGLVGRRHFQGILGGRWRRCKVDKRINVAIDLFICGTFIATLKWVYRHWEITSHVSGMLHYSTFIKYIVRTK